MAEYQEIKESPSYRTLEEIRLRKSQLLVDITKDGNKVEKLWNNLFHKSPDKGRKLREDACRALFRQVPAW